MISDLLKEDSKNVSYVGGKVSKSSRINIFPCIVPLLSSVELVPGLVGILKPVR